MSEVSAFAKEHKWTFIMTAIVPALLSIMLWVVIGYEFGASNLIHVQP